MSVTVFPNVIKALTRKITCRIFSCDTAILPSSLTSVCTKFSFYSHKRLHFTLERSRETNLGLCIGDGQGGLACCESWGHKESDTTERLN